MHVGSGEINDARFINVDARPLKHIHFVTRSLTLLEFPDASVDLVYACHVLEHVSHRLLPQVLANWVRVLKPGGTLRLSVPDFDKLVTSYIDSDRQVERIITPLMGGQDYETNYHYCVFNAAYLHRQLEKAGVTEIRPWSPAELEGGWPEDWSMQDWVSLNLEGVKAKPSGHPRTSEAK